MEAESLSALNVLASNPPQYPEKPTEDKQEPLALYISRVPGTRDVILSPFKPQLKNVTNEDVASSLYYIHLELESTDLAAPAPIRTDDLGSGSDENSSIPRKPLPDNAHPLPDLPGDSTSGQRSSLATDELFTLPPRARAATTGSYDSQLSLPASITNSEGLGLASYGAEEPPKLPPSMQGPPVRKPVGPRALLQPSRPAPERKPVPTSGRRGSDGAPPRSRLASSPAKSVSRSPSPRKKSIFSAPTAEPFTLTLIRRDPSTGSQWNVGRISSHQMDISEQEEQQGRLFASPIPEQPMERPPIDIQIENSGYAKFRGMPQKGALDASSLAAMAANMSNESLPNDGSFFSRQVQMLYSKSWTSNLKDKIHRLEEQMSKKHQRNFSDGSAEEKETTSLGVPLPGMKPRGYVFTSPWDGKCDFRTGNGGRSVRCYHTLNEQPASYNPLVADQGFSLPLPKSSSVAVSELRFNIPGADIFPSSEQDVETRLRGHFAKLLNKDGTSQSEEAEETVSPFELNIGSEKAGGGSRGTRAKLGKLLVYADGLKMLDLVIAANIGVWWGAWERSF